MALLLLISGCTATRPGTLVGKRPLLYNNVKLFLVRGKGLVLVIAMRLSLKHIKRSGRKSREKDFTFYEGANLVICLIILFLASAFANNAFEASITTLKEIYSLIISARKTHMHLRWKTKWAEYPIFRDTETTSTSVRVFESKPLQYQKHRHYFIRIGRACGFEKVLQFYDLRQASGKKITESLTPKEWFIDRDCQTIYLDSLLRDDLKFEISNDSKVLELCKKCQYYADKIKEKGFSTIKAAKGTKFLKCQLRDTQLNQAIQEFHDMINTIEINKQLQGIIPTDVLTPPTMEYELEERTIAAKLFFKSFDNLEVSQVFWICIKLIRNLIELCKRQQTPCQYRASRKRQHISYEDEHIEDVWKPGKILWLDDSGKDFQNLLKGPALYCPFCRRNEEAGPRKCDFVFAHIDGFQKYIREQHLTLMPPNKGLACPLQDCSAYLVRTTHFSNHSKYQHELCLW
ncbi:MAG: hypothetical protein M1840_003088 [Geoglossum simile]|nr:MAG: hypothetical protein M1840_003088 [Geoglossum simile]